MRLKVEPPRPLEPSIAAAAAPVAENHLLRLTVPQLKALGEELRSLKAVIDAV